MKTALQTFRAGVQELLGFLDSAEHESELLRHLLAPERFGIFGEVEKGLITGLADTHTAKRRYIYAVAIVSLYGLLERFVDSVIKNFVEHIGTLVDSYERMPESIQKYHVPRSLDLIKSINEERHRSGVTQEEVIANLHSCLSGAASFKMNGDAFVVHRGNISLDKINKYMLEIGIESLARKIVLEQTIIEVLKTRQPGREFIDIPDHELGALLKPIDDLVDRRNNVSHGVIEVDDIESIDLLRERCHFTSAYAQALFNVLVQNVLGYEINRAGPTKLGNPIAVHSNRIVCFEIERHAVAVGDTLVAITGDKLIPFRFGKIVSLQIDGVDYQEVVADGPTKFGAAVSYAAKGTYEYVHVLANSIDHIYGT